MDFIRGGTNGGKEVDLMVIMPESMKAFSSKDKQEVFASTYEKQHGILVVRPWEKPTEREERRERFEREKAPAKEGETIGMSPAVAERTLRNYLQEYRPDHPDPKRAVTLQTEIHRLQEFLKIPLTDFGAPIDTNQEANEKLQKQFDTWSKHDSKTRRKVVGAVKNIPLLKMIRDTEKDQETLNLAIARLAELELSA